MQLQDKITHIDVEGFKSLGKVSLDLADLNVFIGANGSGKSNFISLIQMIRFCLCDPDGLNTYVAQNNGAGMVLHYGAAHTDTIKLRFDFETPSGSNTYEAELALAKGNRLYFRDERICYNKRGCDGDKALEIELGVGGEQSRFWQIDKDDKHFEGGIQTIHFFREAMRRWCFYQFHNTTHDARIRGSSSARDCSYLRSDGGNLAAFLYMLSRDYPTCFARIVRTIRRVAPYIETLEPELQYDGTQVGLYWTEAGRADCKFDIGQMSDGTLRALALITLLQQPQLPPLVCIDEPELGLHPAAISVIAELISLASARTQLIISTQSERLIDQFEPEDIIVTDRVNGATEYSRLDGSELDEWLEEYTISQMWETNLLGGRP